MIFFKTVFNFIDEKPFKFGDFEITPIPVFHGKEYISFGYKFGNIAYISDVSKIPESSEKLLEGLDILIIDALRPEPAYFSHFTYEQALEVIRKFRPGSYKKGNITISSTFLRKKIRLGKIEEVNRLLGRNWCVIGKVIKGQKRGRKIGFPTCNLKLSDYVVPKLGVYAVKVKSKNFYKNGIANIGYRPTFNGQNLLLETNIFGINKNLYNKVISVNFKKFIRPEKKFRNLNYLKKQIKLDIKKAKKIN